METKKETFSDRLNTLLKAHSVSLASAAKASGVPKATMQSWSEGTQPTNFEAIDRLATYLGTSMAFLLIGKEDKVRSNGLAEAFHIEDRALYEGFAHITVRRVVPRRESE